MYQQDSNVVESSSMQRRQSNFNPSYFKSSFCVIKFILIVVLFCGCFSASFRYSYWFETKYYNFVAITGIVYQIVAICFNLFKVPDRFNQIPWNIVEILHDIIWGILILVGSAVASDYVRRFSIMETYAAAAGFGYFALVLYIIDCIMRIVDIIKIKSKSNQNVKYQQNVKRSMLNQS